MKTLLLLLTFVSQAHAWEGYCRDEDDTPRGSGFEAAVRESICERDDLHRCDPGAESARGVQAGEHTLITMEAMRRAGLPARALEDFDLTYYAREDEYAPAAMGAPTEERMRSLYLAELAEGPDLSHSLSDFMLGNEHCFVPRLASGSEDEIESCHQFEAHMGPINATHWPALAREVYTLYHDHAKRVATRCSDMNQRLTVPPGLRHAALDTATRGVDECMREALAIEAFAAHYLEDVWSTGHMWDRWGSPSVPPNDSEYLRAFLATAMTGIIHGARGVIGTHDQACMPGPTNRARPTSTTIRYRNGEATAQPGGGDLYLLECGEAMAGWNVEAMATSMLPTQRSGQFDAMTSCVALGFREVYSMGPPVLGTLGTATRPQGFAGSTPPTSNADPRCWNARLTNTSMRLGLGAEIPVVGTVLTAYDLADPAVWSRFIVGKFVNKLGDAGVENLGLDLTATQIEAAKQQFRVETTLLAMELIRAAKTDPEGTSFANGEGTESFMGVRRSSAFVSAVQRDDLGYLEHHDEDLWDDHGTMSCTHDSDCMAGHFCDATFTSRDNGSVRTTPSCVPIEASILRAFRGGEMAYWCSTDSSADFSLARSACKAGRGCDACVEMLVPHIRNGCGPMTFEQVRDGIDRRSLCEIVGTVGAIVYAPYIHGNDASLHSVALDLCRGVYGPDDLTTLVEEGRNPSTREPPGFTEDPDGGLATSSRYVCGANPGSQWYRLSHRATPGGHVHEYALRALAADGVSHGDAAKLEVRTYRSPGCTEADSLALPQRLADTNGDGTMDTITITETIAADTPEDICIRVRAAREEQYWTRYRFAYSASLLDL